MAFSKNLIAVIAVTLLAAPTAYAQGRGGGGHGGGARGGGGGRVAVGSMSAGRGVGMPRSSVFVGSRPRGGAVVVGTAGPRVFGAPHVFAGQRVFAAPYASRRVFAAPGVGVGVGFGHAAVRVAPVHFFRPYYAFRPRVSLGFGLWSGFPIAYPYSYGYYNPYYYAPYYDPYGYPYATPYPAYPSTVYPQSAYPQSTYPQSTYPQSTYQPQANSMGGVSFEISPGNAEVFVDGQDMGTVSQFTATSQPLGLTAGRHHVQISAPGYRQLEFDVDVVTGEVVPYQGTLER